MKKLRKHRQKIEPALSLLSSLAVLFFLQQFKVGLVFLIILCPFELWKPKNVLNHTLPWKNNSTTLFKNI